MLLRNPIYVGKILVPETRDEPAHFVKGKHQPLVSEEVFFRVFNPFLRHVIIRNRIFGKEKLREEFPLSGQLKCPECNQLWKISKRKNNDS